MEYIDIKDDTGGASLRLLHRNPFDVTAAIKGFRLHVNDSDLFAGIDIEVDSCAGLLNVFDNTIQPPYSVSWISPDGDWQINIECDQSGTRVLTSQVTSQLVYHPWFVRTSLQMQHDLFCETCREIRAFTGVTN